MDSSSDLGTILLVERDVSLGKVLSQVLAREALQVVHASNLTEALQLAETSSPRLAVVDDSFREGTDSQIVEKLHTRYPDLPLIVMADHPRDALKSSLSTNRFVRFLTKPIDLSDLRQAVETALASGDSRDPGAGETNAGAERLESSMISSIFSSLGSVLPGLVTFAKERVMRPIQLLKVAGIIALVLIVLIGFGMMMGGIGAPWQAAGAEKPTTPPRKAANLVVELVPEKPHTLAVPEDARKDFIAVAKKPTKTRPLVLPGSTMLDPTRLYRVRARFAPSPSSAECVEIEKVRDESSLVTQEREIRSGDRVRKGQVLAVFKSVDVSNKKNDLIDAMYQLHLDQEILNKAEAHADAVPQVFLWNAQRQVAGDQNNVHRALATLRSWSISEEDIKLVQDEAEAVIKRNGKHNPKADDQWPRVEIKSPDDGVIVERNLSLHEIVADNTTNLFQIAQIDRLSVLAFCPEDDLPELEKLPTAQRRWTVRTVGSTPLEGMIDDISYIIDPNQHTAVVKGHIDNPKEVLRAGQFISATVELPPPADVVEIPIDAVSEDGQQAVVFVLADPAKHHYMMRRVQLEARFEHTAFVRSKPFDKSVERTKEEEEQGILSKEPLQPGEQVLQTGVSELKAKLLDLESQPEKK